jgi:hypothetical protein
MYRRLIIYYFIRGHQTIHMKLYYLATLVLLLFACNKPPQIEFSIKATGIKNGVVLFTQAGETVINEGFENGAFNIKRQLAAPGYYNLSIIDNDKAITTKIAYDVYLENGNYLLETSSDQLQNYPKITTTSKIQQELSVYYKLADEMAKAEDDKINLLTIKRQSREARSMSKKDHSRLIKESQKALVKRRELDPVILKKFSDQYPNNLIGAHIMAKQDYQLNPMVYNEIFKKFTEEVKTSEEGLKINARLSLLLKLQPGAEAPDITGNTIDGKPFNKASVKNLVTLVEFWRSDSKLSSLHHEKMVKGIIQTNGDKQKFGLVSVSLDTNKDAWLNAVKNDHLSWPQVSDVKGDDSPNVKNWGIAALPAFYLVDKNWHMIKANVEFVEIDTEVHEYLQKHPN